MASGIREWIFITTRLACGALLPRRKWRSCSRNILQTNGKRRRSHSYTVLIDRISLQVCRKADTSLRSVGLRLPVFSVLDPAVGGWVLPYQYPPIAGGAVSIASCLLITGRGCGPLTPRPPRRPPPGPRPGQQRVRQNPPRPPPDAPAPPASPEFPGPPARGPPARPSPDRR